MAPSNKSTTQSSVRPSGYVFVAADYKIINLSLSTLPKPSVMSGPNKTVKKSPVTNNYGAYSKGSYSKSAYSNYSSIFTDEFLTVLFKLPTRLDER